MKRLGFILLMILLLVGCGNQELTNELDYDDVVTFIMRNQKKATPEVYEACEQVLPQAIERAAVEDYQKVIKVYNLNPDVFSKAMTLGFLSSVETEDPILKDSILAAVERSRELINSEAYMASAELYYAERSLTPEELNDRLTAYEAMISDGYAQLLMERSENTKALAVYEDILVEYKDTEILLNYSKALNNMNRYEASLMASIEALKMTPGSMDAKAEVTKTAEMLGYSKVEINTMIDETMFVGRNLLRQNLLANQLNVPMPEFELVGLDESVLSSKDLEGKIVVVSFFATWCPPCRKELPHLNELYHQYIEDEEVAIIVLSTDVDKYLVSPFIQENGFDFPVYYHGGIKSEFGVKGIPTLFVVDGDGMIRYKKVGFVEGEEFGKIMSWYIDELKADENS